VIRRFSALAVLLIFLVGPVGTAEGGTAPSQGPGLDAPKFIILVMDQISWQDYITAPAPSFREVMEDGAVGVMVARTAGATDRGGFLTIGAGTRLREGEARGIANPEGFAFQPWEQTRFGPAGEFYSWLTGEKSDSAALVDLALPSISNSNADLNYLAAPGLLGETLRQARLRVACLGNADLPGHRNRPAAAIAMDARGQVPLGEVGDYLLEKGNPPRTSVPALLAAFDRLAPQADVLVIDYGDAERIGELRTLLSPETARFRRREAIVGADKFLSALLGRMSGKPWRLLVVTPHLQPDDKEARLTPILLYGDKVDSGWLTSASTRTRGLVVNIDIAPTVLDFFHIGAPAQMLGRPMVSREENKLPPEKLAALAREITRRELLDEQRRLLTRPVMIALIVFFLLCGGGILLNWDRPAVRATVPVLRFAALALLSWPLVLALLGIWLPALGAESFAIMVFACCALGVLVEKGFARRLSPPVLLAALTALALGGDVLWPGQPLMHFSPLSYAPAEAARYYGIGNEFGGVFIAAFLIALSGLWGRASLPARLGQGLLMLLGIALLGMGRLGANFGMTLAGAGAFFAVLFLNFAPGSIWRKVGGICLLAVVAGLVVLEVLQGGQASHLGMAARELGQPGQGQFLGIIVRKLAMNWKLLQNSLWAEVLAGALLLVMVALAEPRRRLAGLLAEAPGARVTFFAILAGGGGAFLFNDSGTVAAALAFSYGALWISYLLLTNELKSPRPSSG
jgi:hypothetical protein